jgi:hypothetical protein
MKKKKSTRQLVGIESMTDSSVLTAGGELTFYLVQPTNLNVLPESGVRTRVTALLNVLKTSAEMELLALDAKESYQDNRLYYRRRAEEEGNPAIRALLAQDRRHLDDVQTMMASSRQVCGLHPCQLAGQTHRRLRGTHQGLWLAVHRHYDYRLRYTWYAGHRCQ